MFGINQSLDIGEPRGLDESKLGSLVGLMRATSISPLKLFIVGKRMLLRIHNGKFEQGENLGIFGMVISNKFDRGEILDFFAKIEFFIDEIICAFLIEWPFSINRLYLKAVYSKIDLNQKIHVLKDEWEIIEEEKFKKLMKLKKARNVLAHSCDYDSVSCGKDGTLKTNFEHFKKDLKFVWERLIVAYNNVQPSDDLIDDVMNFIESKKKNQQMTHSKVS